MKKILMTDEEVVELIDFENNCGINTFLQQIINCKQKPRCFKLVDENNIVQDYIIEEVF